jgi:F-type H+-transporting ATPase subunit delta
MSSVARRYARALFELAQEQGQIDVVGTQLAAAAAELRIPELAEMADSPRLSADRRHALVQAVAEQLSLTPLVTTFLLLVSDNRRLKELSGVAEQFQRLEDQALGRVRMTIRSAVPLSDAQRDAISSAFGRQLERTVIARTAVDPSLLGGVVVEAEGKVYDGSVLSNLERLAERMANPDSH